MDSSDSYYLFFHNYGSWFSQSQQDANYGFITYFDKDFSLLTTKSGNSQNNIALSYASLKQSRSKSAYAVSEVRNTNSDYPDVLIMEIADEIDLQNPVVLHKIQRGTDEWDDSAALCGVDLTDDNTVYVCYSLNCGFYWDQDSWIMIEHLDNELNATSEVYYNIFDIPDECVFSMARAITVLSDGSVLLTSNSDNLQDTDQYWATLTKFPVEAFLSVEEAHANGLKLAIAYPNPGGSEMHIRTTVENAAVEVYDMNGHLVAQQPVTETETVIDATDWAAGTYIWKVVSTQTAREIESGKWVKG